MVPDLDVAGSVCALDGDAVAALESPRRPIVLAPRRVSSAIAIADAVAPGLPDLGVFLPYSPLHHLLVAGVGRPLVMTSGNSSDEPIADDDRDAATRLGPMVDGLLTHDREIHIRCDDSVERATGTRLQLLRRSRGYAPEPMALPFPSQRIALAVGAELKSTIAITRGADVVASHHIGDLEHLATYQSFVQAVDHLPALYGVRPEVVAHDLHPEYLSTKFALDLDLPVVAVQHHHAHVAACMVEHGRTEPVLGRRLRRARLRGRRHALGRRAPGGRLRRVRARRAPPWRPDARRGRGDPRAVAHGSGLGAARGRGSVGAIPRRRPGDRARGRRPGRARARAGDQQHGPAVRRGRGVVGLPDACQLRSAGRDRAGGVGARGRPCRRLRLRQRCERRRRVRDRSRAARRPRRSPSASGARRSP